MWSKIDDNSVSEMNRKLFVSFILIQKTNCRKGILFFTDLCVRLISVIHYVSRVVFVCVFQRIFVLNKFIYFVYTFKCLYQFKQIIVLFLY